MDKRWVEYRILNTVPIVDIYRYTEKESVMLHMMASAIIAGAPHHVVHSHFNRLDPEVYSHLMDINEQAEESTHKGRIVESCALDDWVAPLDDRL